MIEENFAEALCLSEDTDWEGIARILRGRLENRERGDSGEYDTFLVVPMKVLHLTYHIVPEDDCRYCGPPCTCGESQMRGVEHRSDGPCFMLENI